MSAQPSFRLLAITPPAGAVDSSVVTRWMNAAAGLEVAVLLRDVVDPRAALDGDGRLGALADRARALGLPVLWSVDAATLRDTPRSAMAHVDGVQLRGDPNVAVVDAARGQLHKGWIGRSVHQHPSAAESLGQTTANYAVFAPVYSPRTTTTGRSSKKAAGVATLRRWADATSCVFALGGVGADTAAACVAAGAWGLASIHAFFGAPDIEREVGGMVAALRSRPTT